ncbi:hypothetical protein IHE44_0002382 [Lamprotornis superbus]|uniref:C-factor n=1 Tax=Lamprotornis superbus TaxID=245042 RepID=A0A835NWS1_9PASS|nr:hypothetical protein IHE44_0002382 [Lamprotornis superbus]
MAAARTVLLTGSNRGIGLELVKQLLGSPRPPAWIFATCRDPEGPRAQELRDLASKHPNLVLVKLGMCALPLSWLYMGFQFFRAASSPAAKTPASPHLSQLQYPIPWSLLAPWPQDQNHHLVPMDGRAARVRMRRFPRHPPLPLLPSAPVALRLFSPTADVENPSAITDAAKVVEGKLDGMGLNLLINNAGIYTPTASLETVDAEDMVRTYKTNAVGPMLMAQAFLPLLKKAAQDSKEKGLSCSKAAIINISTILGSIKKTPDSFFHPVISYRCSKVWRLPRLLSSMGGRATFARPDLSETPGIERWREFPSSQGISIPTQGKHTLPLEDLALLFLPHREAVMGREPGSCSFLLPMDDASFLTQAALNMLTMCQALTYKEAGILCVALHPGWVKTDMGTQEADLTVDTSVRGLLSVLPILSEKHSGTLLNWEGKAIPW